MMKLFVTCALAHAGCASSVAPRSLLPQRTVMARASVRAPRASAVASADSAPVGRRGALAAVAATGLALARTAPASAAEGGRLLAYSEFLDEVNKDKVDIVTFSAEGNTLLAIDTEGNRQEVAVLPGQTMDLIDLLRKHNVRFSVLSPTQPNALLSIVSSLIVPVLLFGGLTLLTRRGMGGGPGGGPGGMNPFEMGKSRSKIQLEPQTGVVFDDVAGCDSSKLELTEVVEFLKNPAKFTALGAKTPRGVIMEGPPGTGKTLLARAVAGEAGVPFISCSGSEFVEMFVGVGASRVRNVFSEAKKNAPCIIFIDEIDAIGRQRAGSGRGQMGGNDEREQTLNQILTEMDGFEGNQGVIVIAATNRADVLDSALLRPGRFDRRVPVDLPDKEGREAILKVHCKGKPLSANVDLGIVAKRTMGFSGASLANLMNEAAIVAARRDKSEIGYAEVDYAIDRITVGMAKTTALMSPQRQRLVAYHEAGHAIMGALTKDFDLVTKVTIVPRSNGAGGFTLFTPTEERMESGLYSRSYLQAQLAVALGGRVAEEIVFGDDEITTGASNDLQQVRNVARRMVAQWGFAKDVTGAVAWETADGQTGGMMGPKTASAKTNALLDAEVQKIVQKAYAHCKETLTKNRNALDLLAEMLIDNENVDARELYTMIRDNVPGAQVPDLDKLPTSLEEMGAREGAVVAV
ncbi:hypothetical protein KFE25_013729 [Diacronema lutheri]|uniref:AAA+ ATPase domain-containing protein n=1 Tax=Diacronema lutheri TaxID=2081491 RepID=A0A8J5XTI4_DIALT|nr:hypothetical protein KFE25_013729 [Diacronema lutheri]